MDLGPDMLDMLVQLMLVSCLTIVHFPSSETLSFFGSSLIDLRLLNLIILLLIWSVSISFHDKRLLLFSIMLGTLYS